jgi:hypothetical protein
MADTSFAKLACGSNANSPYPEHLRARPDALPNRSEKIRNATFKKSSRAAFVRSAAAITSGSTRFLLHLASRFAQYWPLFGILTVMSQGAARAERIRNVIKAEHPPLQIAIARIDPFNFSLFFRQKFIVPAQSFLVP